MYVVVGGGVVGLFTAYYLNSEGADVVLIEAESLAHSSRAAAGVLEFTKFELNRINVRGYASRYLKMIINGKAAIRRIDPLWLLTYLKVYGRDPDPSVWTFMSEMAQFSKREYFRLAEESNDFELREEPVFEVVEDVEKEVEALKKDPLRPRFEVGELDGRQVIVYLDAVIVSTDLLAERLSRELKNVRILKGRVAHYGDGYVVLEDGSKIEAEGVVFSSGWWCRKLGIPVAPLKGYGVRATTSKRPSRAIADFVRGVFVVPFTKWVKITGRFDVDPYGDLKYLPPVLEAARHWAGDINAFDIAVGFRPCTPDGLPVLEKRGGVVIATGTCRLGWTYGPAMGKIAAELALGKRGDSPLSARRFAAR
ncbi:D-proline dehydrogenase [Pyrobaculum aerophilum]|uniref:D-proline dehydrogenase n=1 Tax=Pyrobaculum aerophilum TaxID=13773 RepID=UPI0023F26121|nr:D-proline dehydrogenase [Pyrobaculum aerophilum]MCX8136954.1 D-proline dehydrogenase [Pyrobaculum aerophilum]